MSADHYQTVLRPVVTEKSHRLTREERGGKEPTPLNQYTFEVATRATRGQIKTAVEELFHVKVAKVNTMRVRGKIRRVRRQTGRTRSWKKAIVTLAPGSSIDLY